MRIAIVLNTSWNIYNFRLGLVKALIENNHELHAIAPHDEYSQKLENLGCIYHPLKMDSRGVNPIKDTALFFELFSLYKKVKPDVILHYTIKPNIYGTLAATTLGIPVINNVCGLGTAFLQKNLFSYIALALYKLAFRTPRKIFFQNEDDKMFFEKNRIVKKGQSEVIPGSGINIEYFTSHPNKEKNSEKNKKFTFLLISRLIYDKGILEYIEAIKHLRDQGIDANFQLLGAKDFNHRRGISAEIIESWAKNNTVEYLGSTIDVRTFIENSDCVVLPSYREGTPRTLLEAASLEKPIVASNVPGCTNIVEHGKNGLLCEVKNSEDLAEKMCNMVELSEVERVKMGRQGRAIIEERFDEGVVIEKYLGEIDNIGR